MKIYKCHTIHLKIALLCWLKMALSFIRTSGVLIISSRERHNLHSGHFDFQTHSSRQKIFFKFERNFPSCVTITEVKQPFTEFQYYALRLELLTPLFTYHLLPASFFVFVLFFPLVNFY